MKLPEVYQRGAVLFYERTRHEVPVYDDVLPESIAMPRLHRTAEEKNNLTLSRFLVDRDVFLVFYN